MEVVDTLLEQWPDRQLTIGAGDNAQAADTDVVVIATPWDGATQTAVSSRTTCEARSSCRWPTADQARQGVPAAGAAPGSVAASVQAAVPHCKVAAALHHVPAKELGDLRHPIESDVLICSDHASAVELTSEIVAKIPNMRPLNAGELAMATPIESFTAVLLQLNMHYKTRVAVKLTGIPDAATRDGAVPGLPGSDTEAESASRTGRKGNGSSGKTAPAEPKA